MVSGDVWQTITRTDHRLAAPSMLLHARTHPPVGSDIRIQSYPAAQGELLAHSQRVLDAAELSTIECHSHDVTTAMMREA